MYMKTLLSLFILLASLHLQADAIQELRGLINYGTYKGRTESGENCTLEIDRLSNGNVQIYLFNPRVNRFEFGRDDHFEVTADGIKISSPTVFEDNARITESFILDGKIVGIEREFCTYKCWVSMRPCIIDRY